MWHYLPFGPFDEFPDFENFYTTLSKKHDSNLYFVVRVTILQHHIIVLGTKKRICRCLVR